MRRICRVLPTLLVAALLGGPVLAGCETIMPIEQGGTGGNFFTDPGRAYGGWFWMAGHGNGLLNGQVEGNVGIDSGMYSGVPQDPTPYGTSWLVDFLGDKTTRMLTWDWDTPYVDGCGDLNGNRTADRDEVLVVLVVDSTGEEYALASVGGTGVTTWSLADVNNGVPSAQGTPANGVPMTPVPEPRFGKTRELTGGGVETEILLPSLREVPTYDDVGGSRQMVQGFHALVGDQLLAEAVVGTKSVKVRTRAGERLVLRTVFGVPGDVGFFVDGYGTVPTAGTPAQDRGRPEDTGSEPTGGERAPAAAAGAAITAGTITGEGEAPGEADTDVDEDGVPRGEDNCPDVGNPEQDDSDEDGIGDMCDLCPFEADATQADTDADGLGDACDQCPADPENQDRDGDGECDGTDNCPDAGNAGQEDADGDGMGDVCDPEFDPFVVDVEPQSAKALAGGSVALAFAVDNRADTTRSLELWVELTDAKKTTTRIAAGPGCLEKVPFERNVAAGDGFELECSVPVPADAAKGAATIRVVARDKEKPETPGEATVKVTIQ